MIRYIRIVISQLPELGVCGVFLAGIRKLFLGIAGYISKSQRERRCRRKITHIYAHHKLNLEAIDPAIIGEHVRMWSALKRRVNTKWARVYMYVSGIHSAKYIPEDIFYGMVQPCLNYSPMEKAFSDKNLYDKGQYRDLFPKTLLRNINGILYDSTYAPIVVKDPLMQLLNGCDEVIVKPSIDSGGGRSVELFVRNDDIYINHKGHVLSLAHLNQIFEKNYILQEKLTQHESLSRFNQSSVNTIRVFTYRSVVTEKVVALHAVLRIGREGSVVDNQASGGISVGIDNEGVLNKYAIDKMGNKYYRIGTIDLQHTYKLIKFAEMIELARKIATDYLYTRMLGFDITLDSDQAIRIIEINNGSIEINFHQMNSGPLFGCYTEEVIDYCVKNKLGEEAIA